MPASVVKVALNQQQLELLDRTIADGIAEDRAALIRLALKEFAARHGSPKSSESRSEFAVADADNDTTQNLITTNP